MRDMIFLRCEVAAARQADQWARRALRGFGVPEDEARAAALRLAAGFRAAATAFRRVGAPACARDAGRPPKAVVVLAEEDGALEFELIADGQQCSTALARAPSGRLWQAAERRCAGDGATRLRMPACRRDRD